MGVMPQKENKNQVEWFLVDLNAQDKYSKIEQNVYAYQFCFYMYS